MNFFQQAQEVPRCYKELYDKHGKVLGYDIKRQNNYICIDNSLWSTCITLNITPICSLFLLRIYYYLKPYLMVADPDMIKEILVDEFSKFHDRKVTIKLIFFGNRTWLNPQFKYMPDSICSFPSTNYSYTTKQKDPFSYFSWSFTILLYRRKCDIHVVSSTN